MIGMNCDTGTGITGAARVRECMCDILTTPIGSRLRRRDYGSLLPGPIDQPQSAATRVRLYAAVASALMPWEPRLRLSRIAYSGSGSQGMLELEGEDAGTGRALSLRVPLQLGGVG